MVADLVSLLPPQDLEAEQACLGSMLLEPGAPARAFVHVKPDDFYREVHKTICRAMHKLWRERTPIDPVIVCSELRRMGRLDECGGPEYLTALIGEVPTAAHVVRYAKVVASKARLRRLIVLGDDAVRAAFEQRDEPEVILQGIHAEVLKLAQEQGLRPRPIADQAELMFAETWDSIFTDEAWSDLRFGIRRLDKRLQPLAQNATIVIQAPTGAGKTRFLTKMLCSTLLAMMERDRDTGAWRARSDKRVMLFQLEDRAQRQYELLLAHLSGLGTEALRRGSWADLAEGEVKTRNEKLMAAQRIIEAMPLDIRTSDAGLTTSDVVMDVRSAVVDGQLEAVLIDYAQQLEGDAADGWDNLKQFQGAMKRVCKELQDVCPVVLTSQISTGADGTVYGYGSRVPEQRAGLRLYLEPRRGDGDKEKPADLLVVHIPKSRYTAPLPPVVLHADLARCEFYDDEEHSRLMAVEQAERLGARTAY